MGSKEKSVVVVAVIDCFQYKRLRSHIVDVNLGCHSHRPLPTSRLLDVFAAITRKLELAVYVHEVFVAAK